MGGTGDPGDDQPGRGRDPVDRALARLDNAVEAARNALAAIDRGDGNSTVGRLGALRNQLDAIRRTLDAGDKLPAGVASLVDRRIDRLDERVRLAVDAVSTNVFGSPSTRSRRRELSPSTENVTARGGGLDHPRWSPQM